MFKVTLISLFMLAGFWYYGLFTRMNARGGVDICPRRINKHIKIIISVIFISIIF